MELCKADADGGRKRELARGWAGSHARSERAEAFVEDVVCTAKWFHRCLRDWEGSEAMFATSKVDNSGATATEYFLSLARSSK